MKILETMVGKTKFEVKVSSMDTNSSDGIITEASNYKTHK